MFEDEHVKAIELVQDVKLADGSTVKLVGPPVEYSDSTNCIHSPPPLLGEHTDHVLSQVLNYSPEKIEELKKNGHIK